MVQLHSVLRAVGWCVPGVGAGRSALLRGRARLGAVS